MELNNSHDYKLVIQYPDKEGGFKSLRYPVDYPKNKGIINLQVGKDNAMMELYLPEGEFGHTENSGEDPKVISVHIRLQSVNGEPFVIGENWKDASLWTSEVIDNKLYLKESVLLYGGVQPHFYLRANKLIPCRTSNYDVYDRFVKHGIGDGIYQ